jgi:acetylornithine deacetylase/succinyl-diaminopimelate desuccinylase-like protein
VSAPQEALALADERHACSVAELCAFVRHPTISADPRRRRSLWRCARWLARVLRRNGLDTAEVVDTGGAPAVVARAVRSGRPRVLVYGHYDVQPVAPRSAWAHPPFEPRVVAGRLHGRGTADDKGPIWAHVAALAALIRSGELRTDVTLLLEGEEEVGSPNLDALLTGWRHPTDVVVVSDTRMAGPDRPAIVDGLRGALNLAVELRRPGGEVHSGAFGGVVANPAHALADVVSSFHDVDGAIAVPGFHRAVRRVRGSGWAPVEDGVRTNGRTTATSTVRRSAGVVDRRTTDQPSLDVTSFESGYHGPGWRSAIPDRATARINVRLVPDQDPTEVARLLTAHVRRATPPGMTTAVRVVSSTPPVVLPAVGPAFTAAAEALRRAFGNEAVVVRSGGTIPAVAMLHRRLQVPVVVAGFALDTDRVHAPGEHFGLARFRRATHACIWLHHLLGAAGP